MRRTVAVLIGAAVLLSVPMVQAAPPEVCSGANVNDFRSTDVADFLVGSDDVDVVALGDGGDQYFGGGSGDILCGNDGPDVLGGEEGPDELVGGAGADIIAGHTGGDSLLAGEGEDRIDGGAGADSLQALFVDDLRDDIYDGTGTDVIEGNAEDVWHRCDDGVPDDRSGFVGSIIPDPDC